MFAHYLLLIITLVSSSLSTQSTGRSFNSEYLKNRTVTWPPSWADPPIRLSIISNERYIHHVDIFFQTMTSLGFEAQDLAIACSTKKCSELLNKRNIVHFNHVPEQSAPGRCISERCNIGISKAMFILSELEKGHTVFFIDLDVFFKSCPLKAVNPGSYHIELIAQDDHDPRSKYNFGLFLVRSSNKTKTVFREMIKYYSEFGDPCMGSGSL